MKTNFNVTFEYAPPGTGKKALHDAILAFAFAPLPEAEIEPAAAPTVDTTPEPAPKPKRAARAKKAAEARDPAEAKQP